MDYLSMIGEAKDFIKNRISFTIRISNCKYVIL
jgi:hypothetical protein